MGTGHPFRPIQYLGNKWRLLDRIEQQVDAEARGPGPVCDLFAGSGVVAARLATKHSVIAADVQEYSRLLCSALLEPHPVPSSLVSDLLRRSADRVRRIDDTAYGGLVAYETESLHRALAGDVAGLCGIVEDGSLLRQANEAVAVSGPLQDLLGEADAAMPAATDTVLSRYYGGLYFSYRQAAELDSLAAAARLLPPPFQTMALAAAVSTASELVSTVGSQFAQPLRPRDRRGIPKAPALVVVARRRRVSATEVFTRWLSRYGELRPATRPHDAVRADYRQTLANLPADTSVVYADPPYTRDHYSRFYHVLETIALGDDPGASTLMTGHEPRLSRALYRRERHQSPFCIRSQVLPAFSDLFAGVAKLGAPLLVSYSPYTTGTPARPQPRLVTVDQIADLASRYFGRVDVRSAGRIAHSKLNQEDLNGKTSYAAEVFIVAKD